MTLAVDERAHRLARARVVAASIIDTPHLPRRFQVDGDALVASPRRRLHRRPAPSLPAAPMAPRGRLRRRHVALAVLLLQLLALAAVLLLPTFRVRDVEVGGAHLLSREMVLRAAALGPHQSIFSVDGEGLRRRVAAIPWVRSVTVETALPGTVRIDVVERQPVMRVRRLDEDDLVAAGGATLAVADAGTAALPALPVLDDRRSTAAGAAPPAIDPGLMAMLADAAARFQPTYGCALSSFLWQQDGLLTIVAAPGWRAILGRVDSPQRIAAVPEQLAALAALRGRLNLAHPDFGYIDLENPELPAVGGRPGAALPAYVPPAPPPSSAATPSPAASPAATPQVSPGATPGGGASPGPPASPGVIGVPLH